MDPIAGIMFRSPCLFFFLISISQHILLPKLIPKHHLQELDAAKYEEVTGAPGVSISLSFISFILQPFAFPFLSCIFQCLKFASLFNNKFLLLKFKYSLLMHKF